MVDDARTAANSQPRADQAPAVSSPLDDAGADPDTTPVQVGPYRCAAHPQVETYLRCGRCERPICPRCMIQTPVGARCRECARMRRPPMYEVGWVDYLRATAAALGTGYGSGLVLQLLQLAMPFAGFLMAFILAGLGYVVGEVTARATRKRGTLLGVIAAAATVVGIALARASFFLIGGAHPLIAFVAAFGSLLIPIWGLIGLALGAFIAFSRLR